MSLLVARHAPRFGLRPEVAARAFVGLDGKELLLGAPQDAVAVVHYAAACAKIPRKRRARYSVPVLNAGGGQKSLHDVEELGTDGILNCYADAGGMDAVERISRDYLKRGRHRSGRVGAAECQLIDAGNNCERQNVLRAMRRLSASDPFDPRGSTASHSTHGYSAARSSAAMSILPIPMKVSMTFGSGEESSVGRCRGMICQDRPKRSFSQPQRSASGSAESARQ